ncbi:MAG: serine/threonine protein kinase [Planctomycetes bacterium]|nr:serine/threonine protein kinase [Planctomycetota bacterium]
MATPTTVQEFLELVEKSELLEKSRLLLFVKTCQENGTIPSTPKECAVAMVKEGIITAFQGKLLLAGKWKNFFLGGKYKVLDHLGAGGMGTVLLCEHRHMRRRVAVKILPPEKNQQSGCVERFVREAQAVARLDHPKSAGLQHACDSKLVHRDIKPSNLLLDRGGLIKILDLGLARFSQGEDHLTKLMDSKTVLGTADYLAPEQARDSAVDIRADIYSLGVLAYFLLIGKPPFDGGNVAQKLIAHQTKTPTPISALRPVPAAVSTLISSMMAKDPARRPQLPHEIISALSPWFVEVPPPTPEELPESRYTHHRDIDTMSRLSTVATMSAAMRSKILQTAEAMAAQSQH